MTAHVKEFFYWGVGSLAILALAAAEPDLATVLVLVLIAGVLFAHANEYLDMFNTATANDVKKGS